MTENEKHSLVERALTARGASYSPYSRFAVGAALLTADGEIFTGANIESASYSPTVCAERVAFFSAVHSGKRDFKAIAIVGGPASENIKSFTAPCGVCRQVMAEFCDDSFEIIIAKSCDDYKAFTLCEILPERFSKNNVSEE